MTAELVPAPAAAIGTVIDLRIPDTIEDLSGTLDHLGGAIAKGGWWTAAAVYAWTEPGTGGPRTGRELGQLSEREFAALGIRGLSSRDSVRRYRSAWERAVERGWVIPSAPGEVMALPEQDFNQTEAHVGANSGEQEWFTPAEYIDAARVVMGGIDLDPASTETANAVVGATAYFTKDDAALTQTWAGRVWMNPPYAQPLVWQFCERLSESFAVGSVTEACVLVNNATETAFFQRMAELAAAICFPAGRVKFWHPERVSAPLQGQAVLYFGPHVDAFRAEFLRFGFTVTL